MGEKWDHMKEGATEKYDSIKETVKDKYNELKGDAGHFCDEAFSQRNSFLETTKDDMVNLVNSRLFSKVISETPQ